MDLIFGGAYQGKLEYAKRTFNIGGEEIFTCQSQVPEIDFGKRVIYKTEDFVLACVRNGIEAKDYFRANMSPEGGTVVICTDLSQGIVPVEADYRAWREMTGRLMTYLAEEAGSVTRVFCGLSQQLK